MATGLKDDWIIERWRTDPRPAALEFGESLFGDQTPPLWKDLAIASVIAILLWGAAAIVFA